MGTESEFCATAHATWFVPEPDDIDNEPEEPDAEEG